MITQRIYLFGICLVCLFTPTYGQNLISNGSFEKSTACPQSPSDLGLIDGWNLPNNGGSPDYFKSCSKNEEISVPQNKYGYLLAGSGNSYAGIVMCNPHFLYLEYLETELLQNLKKTPFTRLN